VASLRSALYFDGNGVARPVLVMTAWLVVGFVLMLVAEAARSRMRSRTPEPAVSAG
jgi:hypothetical protein